MTFVTFVGSVDGTERSPAGAWQDWRRGRGVTFPINPNPGDGISLAGGRQDEEVTSEFSPPDQKNFKTDRLSSLKEPALGTDQRKEGLALGPLQALAPKAWHQRARSPHSPLSPILVQGWAVMAATWSPSRTGALVQGHGRKEVVWFPGCPGGQDCRM